MIPQTHDQPQHSSPRPPDGGYDQPQRSGGLGWLWFILVLAVIGAGGWYYWTYIRPTLAPKPSGRPAGATTVPVLVATARIGDLPVYLDGLGTVIPLNTVSLHTRVDGQVMQVDYKEGQDVTSDQHLLTIDPRPFQVQLRQANGQLQKDQALLENAKLDLQRYLEVGSAATQQQIDTQKALISQDEGNVEIDRSAIDNANLELTYCQITSPINGRIGLRLVDAGNIVHAADTSPLAVITQTQPITVVFTLPQQNIPPVIAKMSANPPQKLEVDAYNVDLRHKLATGTLMAADSQIDVTTGNLRFKAQFDNSDLTLFPNEFVNARLLLDVKKDVVIVPIGAVQRSPTGTFVYVVQDHTNKEGKMESVVAMQEVKLGPTEGQDAMIASGVNAGDIVVVEGVDKLVKGSKVSTTDVNAVKQGTTKPTTSAGASAKPSTATVKEMGNPSSKTSTVTGKQGKATE